ncbi:MAG: hypothetical protein FJ293_15265 [Planctomycetes bacterium]|nr:hypothetical protein [Planctomycetota bacterium]
MNRIRSLVVAAVALAAPTFAITSWVAAQGAPPQGGPPAGRGGPPGGDEGNVLVNGLKATKGCLGVETAMTASRKSVIFAWFEDKKAAMRWYESDVHQTFMLGMAEGAAAAGGEYGDAEAAAAEEREPMAGVPDGVPFLCIATITPATKQAIPGFPMPISQVSIELYTPLPGGLSLNGKFAPAELKVPGMVEETLPLAPAGGATAPAAPAGGNGTGGAH